MKIQNISFNDEDRKLAKEIVYGRNTKKREFYGDTSFFDASRKSKECDYLGALAEIATAKFLGLPLSEVKIIPPFGKDPGYDLIWSDYTIEVKYTFYKNGHLFHRPNRAIISDIFVLVTGTEKEMSIAGYISKEEFKSMAELKDFGYGYKPVLAVSQQKLHNIKYLKNKNKGVK